MNMQQRCEVPVGDPAGIVIFGASGDLTRRKLIPALYRLFAAGRLSQFFIVGVARTDFDDAGYRGHVEQSIKEFVSEYKPEQLDRFLNKIFYLAGQYDDDESYQRLKIFLSKLSDQFETQGNVMFDIATPPSLYPVIVTALGENGLIQKGQNKAPFQRVVVEKPFGRDYDSAVALNKTLLTYLDDHQIYRIDHYLGKDTVQNILVFRFANAIFENVWNHHYIDNIQITVTESLGVGHRAGYFEQSGLIRDMLQNHMLQLLSLVAMEPPVNFDADRVRDERVKLMRSIRPYDLDQIDDQLVMGQYKSGSVKGEDIPDYREERGVDPDSTVETYFATKMMVDNVRWAGVPFYLRAGKGLKRKKTQIVVVFKKLPFSMFHGVDPDDALPANQLIFNIQPTQGISLQFQAKSPGSKLCLRPLKMEFDYHKVFGGPLTDDYETLLLDCILGDQILFWRRDGVEQSWKIMTPILKWWASLPLKEREAHLKTYPAGSWGPEEANQLLQFDLREWVKEH